MDTWTWLGPTIGAIATLIAALIGQFLALYIKLRTKRKSYLFKKIENISTLADDIIKDFRSTNLQNFSVEAYDAVSDIKFMLTDLFIKPSIIKINKYDAYLFKLTYYVRRRKWIKINLDDLNKIIIEATKKMMISTSATNKIILQNGEAFKLAWKIKQILFELLNSFKINVKSMKETEVKSGYEKLVLKLDKKLNKQNEKAIKIKNDLEKVIEKRKKFEEHLNINKK